MKEIYEITAKFPKEERYCLVDQLRRAVISITLNIAEGSDRKPDIEFKKFLRSSIGSLEEVVACLYIALDLGYINQKLFEVEYEKANITAKRLNALINSLTNNSIRR